MQIEKFSYACAIFNRTLDTIEDHKRSFDGTVRHQFRQSRNWWKCLPEFAKQNLRDHTFLGEETPQTIRDFYWGDE